MASPAQCGARRRYTRKDSAASGATPNEAWVSHAAPRITLVALAALIGAAGSSASAATPMDGLRVYTPVADTYVTAARARANFGRSQRCGSTPHQRPPRSSLRLRRNPAASVTLLWQGPGRGRPRFAASRTTSGGAATDVCGRLIRHCGSRPRAGSAGSLERGRRDVLRRAGDEEVSLAITTHGRHAITFGSRVGIRPPPRRDDRRRGVGRPHPRRGSPALRSPCATQAGETRPAPPRSTSRSSWRALRERPRPTVRR